MEKIFNRLSSPFDLEDGLHMACSWGSKDSLFIDGGLQNYHAKKDLSFSFPSYQPVDSGLTHFVPSASEKTEGRKKLAQYSNSKKSEKKNV